MNAPQERNEPRKATRSVARKEAAGRNVPAGASGIAPGGQVGLKTAIKWAGRLSQLFIDMERNRNRWHHLAEGYLAALKGLQAEVQDLKESLDLPRQELEEKLKYLELSLAMVVEGDSWRASYAEAEQEAKEIRKRREEMLMEVLRRRKA